MGEEGKTLIKYKTYFNKALHQLNALKETATPAQSPFWLHIARVCPCSSKLDHILQQY